MSTEPAKKLKLWQDDAGRWCCSSPELPNTWVEGDSPDEAVKNMQAALADLRQMVSHFAGTCPADCRWCRDHPKTKGIRAKKTRTPAPAGP